MVIGDVHAPFQHDDTLQQIIKVAAEEKPQAIVQVGDLYDFFSLSRFPKKPGVIHPSDEIEQAYAIAAQLWDELHNAAPTAELYQLLGNHCVRPLKMTLERCPELYPLVQKSWKLLFKFTHVDTVLSTRDDLELDNIIFEHGFYTQPGRHLKKNMKPTVFGHTHRPWIHYERIRNQLLWEMNVGYAADPRHEALNYTPKRFVEWVHGYGMITDKVPAFIPC